jgi:hypothetical protein
MHQMHFTVTTTRWHNTSSGGTNPTVTTIARERLRPAEGGRPNSRPLVCVVDVRTSQKKCFGGNDPTKCNTKIIIQTRNSEGNL